MKAQQLASRVAQESGLNPAQSSEVVNAIVRIITHELREQGVFKLFGFGAFRLKERKARKGRNPRTGELIEIPARQGVRWTASKKLLRTIKEGPGAPLSRRALAPPPPPVREITEAEAFLMEKQADMKPAARIITPPPTFVAPPPVSATRPPSPTAAPAFPQPPAPAPAFSPEFALEEEKPMTMPTPGAAAFVPSYTSPIAPKTPPGETRPFTPSRPITSAVVARPVTAVPAEDPALQRARRTAKVNVDDLFLYFGDQISEAIRAGKNPADAVSDQLNEARRLLLRRVGEEVSGKADFIGDAFRKRLETFQPN